MALVSRGVKANTGTTSFGTTGNVVADLEFDINALTSGVNGGLDNTNIAPAAGIQISKLETIDPEDIDDQSENDAEQDEQASPGDYTARTLATSVRNEIRQLRYKIAENAGVLSAVRNDATAEVVTWIEQSAKGENLVANGNFTGGFSGSGVAQVPYDWTAVGPPASTTVFASAASDGGGWECAIVSGAAGQGIRYTITDKLKASTKYLISYRVAILAGAGEFTTTGGMAAGQWRNIAATMQVFAGAAFTDYKAVVQTTAVPAPLVLNWLSTGVGDVIKVKEVSVRELGATDRVQNGEQRAVVDPGVSTGTSGDVAEHDINNISTVEVVPSGGYYVRLTFNSYLSASPFGSDTHTATLRIKQDGTIVGQTLVMTDTAETHLQCVAMTRLVQPAVAGSHTYTVTVQSSNAGTSWSVGNPTLFVEIIPARIV